MENNDEIVPLVEVAKLPESKVGMREVTKLLHASEENKLTPQNPDTLQVSDENAKTEFDLKVGGAGVTLKLGDIIQLYAPQNEDIHEQTYIIDYIDVSCT